ncbi:carbamate kinase, partial [Melaminivora alkalimesophila]|uniref:carbamate kinase n=1 Tax=Melaminivora alkalimesophila TaxID=1165852 RepID=UPI001FEF0AFF
MVALGGNAILQPGQRGSYAEQRHNVDVTAAQLADLVAAGHELVLTHGNGPQVGNLLLQNEEAKATVEPMPLDVLGAMTQGMIGYMFQQSLTNELRARGIQRPVVSLVTQVEVDVEDPAFNDPTKPIGPFYPEEEAAAIAAERGYIMQPDSGRGWRRVVPSPQPGRVVEQEVVSGLLSQGAIIIAAGGGGVPVRTAEDGALTGVEAVIDKDRAAAALARAVGADMLMILTDVPNVKLHYGTPNEVSLGEVSAEQMASYVAEKHFAAGSMGPKVTSCLDFVRQTGKQAIITALNQAVAAAAGE